MIHTGDIIKFKEKYIEPIDGRSLVFIAVEDQTGDTVRVSVELGLASNPVITVLVDWIVS